MTRTFAGNLWNSFLLDLAGQLTTKDIKDMKYLLKDNLPARIAETLDAQSLLTELEKRKIFSKQNLSALKEIMVCIHRRDLAERIEQYEKSTPTDYADNKEPSEDIDSSGSFSVLDQPLEYQMEKSPRGCCLIFSNKFKESVKTDDGKTLGERNGTEADVTALKKTFEWLKFKVTDHLNTSVKDMTDIMRQVSDEDHSDYDCFVCCILTHGYEGGIFGNDGQKITIKEIIDTFAGDECRSLLNKPKLFFIQACQGEADSKSVSIQADTPVVPRDCKPHIPDEAEAKKKTIPGNADFFFFMATTPGTVSWRHPVNGSWFIQTLTKVLQEHAHDWPLSDIYTEVNRLITEKEDYVDGDIAKQMSDAGRYTLTRKLFFHPGSPYHKR